MPLGPSAFLPDALLASAEWIDTNAGQASETRFGRWSGFHDTLQNAREELQELATAIAPVYEDEPKRLIHGSYDQTAVSFDGLGLADVRNFDQLGYDVRLVDLSRALAAFCATSARPDIAGMGLDPALLKEFLSAYEEESPLSAREADALPLFMRANHLVQVVNEYRSLLAPTGTGGESNGNLEAEVLSVALKFGRLRRPPPNEASAGEPPAG
jgi:Ser/Thr protein kinase RdoA (MazF antagonist)